MNSNHYPHIDPSEYYRKTLGLLRPDWIRSKTVLAVGAGSGNGFALECLGRVGARLVVVDLPAERLEPHNLIRHVLGAHALGQLKVEAVPEHIRALNPAVQIRGVGLDVEAGKESFAALVMEERPAVIMVGLDNEQAKQAVNEVAVAAGVIQVIGGVYDGGVGGEICIIRPGDACYACMGAVLHRRNLPRREVDLDYNDLNLEEVRSTCALFMDIQQIALLQAKVVLSLLEHGDLAMLGIREAVNYIVFSNRQLEGTFARPLHAEFFAIPRNEECLMCAEMPGLPVETSPHSSPGVSQG